MRKIILAAAAAALIVATAPSFAGFGGDQPGRQFGDKLIGIPVKIDMALKVID
jgi:hypothetical protein